MTRAIILEYSDGLNINIVGRFQADNIDACKRIFSEYIIAHLNTCPEVTCVKDKDGRRYDVNPLYNLSLEHHVSLFPSSKPKIQFPYLPLYNPSGTCLLVSDIKREYLAVQTDYEDKYGKWKLIILT